ncbi:tripartite tricarboxylate transporter TctB family protein [Tranquillimonas alkanivorans]|uniref:Tripartite tricarboxylate transporter TctB family protein n=1 Tax=Tranquillimonas alkanivorans TaxID=441119 RepID=A0A1I5TL17_9RHOB|nr:tripartite tricarboxylate transporter TctB family protein [Tranquillimonas alkanivorans]SFP83713.1 Tripartite tricarboxylate transporter TctB family protein [Tranquillimonas alkanivorans]
MRASELIFIAGIAVFAAVLCVQSTDFRYFSNQGFGPGFVPLNFAALTLLLAFYLLVKARLNAEGPFLPEHFRERAKAALPAVIAAFLLFAGTYAMEWGSVLAPLFVVMIVISVAFVGHTLVQALVLNAVTLAAIYGIFRLWLNIPVT